MQKEGHQLWLLEPAESFTQTILGNFCSLEGSLILAVKRKDGLVLPFMCDIVLQLTASSIHTLVET